ncbi:MAG: hypothetical protein ACREVB_16900 [Burkholderiales bacterium]
MRVTLVLLLALAAAGCFAPPRAAEPLYGREAVALEPAERDFVLAEMRQFVQAIRGIIEGVADNDMKAVAAAARAVGVQVQRSQISVPGSAAAGVARKVPAGFRTLGLATHTAFDEMALHAEQSGARDQLLAALADNLRRCVACHAAYRFPE